MISQIHYELNPYKSKGDLKKLYPKLSEDEKGYIERNIQIKKSKARAGKEWWKLHNSHEEYRYNASIGDDLYTLVTFKQTVAASDTVSDFLNRIKPFIDLGESLVDYLMI